MYTKMYIRHTKACIIHLHRQAHPYMREIEVLVHTHTHAHAHTKPFILTHTYVDYQQSCNDIYILHLIYKEQVSKKKF